MNITRKIATTAVVVLALGGAGIGTAVASSHGAARAHPASAEPTSPDTDNLQVGDQTSPDTPAVSAAQAAGSARAGASHAKSDGSGEENGSENDASDGPGGHADPSGNVQHEFDGVE
jgi:hypothetical protein